MGSPGDKSNLVATSGPIKGLHSGMGIAAKSMIICFVVFTVINVDFDNGI